MAPAATSTPVSSVVNPAAVPMKNSFSGMVMAFPNVGIQTLVAKALTFRKQLTVRPERLQQSGWNNELNVFMAQGLNGLDKYCRRIVYNSISTQQDVVLGPNGTAAGQTVVDQPVGTPAPGVGTGTANAGNAGAGTAAGGMTETQIEQLAADPTSSLLAEFNNNSPDIDNVLPPPNGNRGITAVLDGTDLNLPQLDQTNCPNDQFRGFIEGLDNFAVQATRLDSRNDPNVITKYENAMLHGLLSQLWAILKDFGGENNRMDIPAGTLPDDEPNTFMGGAQTVNPATAATTAA